VFQEILEIQAIPEIRVFLESLEIQVFLLNLESLVIPDSHLDQ
jgi:hypothetical protein